MIRRPPRSTRFPCAPLFRSERFEDGVLGHGCGPWGLIGGEGRRRRPAFLPPRDTAGEEGRAARRYQKDRKSTRLNSSHANISYAVFCLEKKNARMATSLYR